MLSEIREKVMTNGAEEMRINAPLCSFIWQLLYKKNNNNDGTGEIIIIILSTRKSFFFFFYIYQCTYL